MKKTVMLLLAGALILSAVEWNVEQITFDEDLWNMDPLLAVDRDGLPWLLYTQWGDIAQFMIAHNDGESWHVSDSIELGYRDNLLYSSIVGQGAGEMFMSYADTIEGIDGYELFLATDEDGRFEISRLTDDYAVQQAPVIQLDNDGLPHLVFIQCEDDNLDFQLFHGWFEEGELVSEQITDNVYQDEYSGYDLVFDSENVPHVFYIGNDEHLWHTAPGEAGWAEEKLNELSCWYPSAALDQSGAIYVAYDVEGNSIHLVSDKNGTWQDELVSDFDAAGGGNARPNVDIDSHGNPHVTWIHADAEWWYDLYYANKLGGSWVEQPVLITSELDEFPGFGRYFALDDNNYGHITYCAEDEHAVSQIYYAMTSEPVINTGIADETPGAPSFKLDVRGASIRFDLPYSSFVNINLYDASGRLVKEIASGSYAHGEHTLYADYSGLTSGVYFVRAVYDESKVETARLVLVK